MPQWAKSKGLVVDLRRNRGGGSQFAMDVLATLVDAPANGVVQASRLYVPVFRAVQGDFSDWRPLGMEQAKPNTEAHYSGPVVVLCSGETFSAAENFLVAFKTSKRGKIVGTASAGSTGQPLMFRLPGGGFGRVCTKRSGFADGTAFIGVGVQPDIVVDPLLREIQAGQDSALDTALSMLRE
jgi:C-terminal processing protease CtpA/Prc